MQEVQDPDKTPYGVFRFEEKNERFDLIARMCFSRSFGPLRYAIVAEYKQQKTTEGELMGYDYFGLSHKWGVEIRFTRCTFLSGGKIYSSPAKRYRPSSVPDFSLELKDQSREMMTQIMEEYLDEGKLAAKLRSFWEISD